MSRDKSAAPSSMAVSGVPERGTRIPGASAGLRNLAGEYCLTPREEEVLRGLSSGLTTKEIARQMNLGVNTVKTYLRLIMMKMGVSTIGGIVGKLLKDANFEKSQEVRYGSGDPGSRLPVESVLDRAIQVIGDRDEAMRWLGTPIRALDYATPISLLGTTEGAVRVEHVLGQIEHGVW